ncbi:MAG: HD domain-containing protein [Nanoarchaeota archaeon]|nr:HD domain-containing protein [Nanoarchaeota archaeon]
MNAERFRNIISFLEEIDSFKSVLRASYIKSGGHESDSDHAWHMCIYALLLHSELKLDLDLKRTLELILIHDLVEIYATDTYIYDVERNRSKKEREDAAAKKLFSTLPQNSCDMINDLWSEFEDCKTPESRFANALDRLQALGQSVFTKGKVWKEKGITQDMTKKVNKKAFSFDPGLKEVFRLLYEKAKKGSFWAKKRGKY